MMNVWESFLHCGKEYSQLAKIQYCDCQWRTSTPIEDGSHNLNGSMVGSKLMVLTISCSLKAPISSSTNGSLSSRSIIRSIQILRVHVPRPCPYYRYRTAYRARASHVTNEIQSERANDEGYG